MRAAARVAVLHVTHLLLAAGKVATHVDVDWWSRPTSAVGGTDAWTAGAALSTGAERLAVARLGSRVVGWVSARQRLGWMVSVPIGERV